MLQKEQDFYLLTIEDIIENELELTYPDTLYVLHNMDHLLTAVEEMSRRRNRDYLMNLSVVIPEEESDTTVEEINARRCLPEKSVEARFLQFLDNGFDIRSTSNNFNKRMERYLDGFDENQKKNIKGLSKYLEYREIARLN